MKQKYMPKIRRRCNPSTILRENIKNAPTLQKNMRKFILNMKEYIDKSDDGLTAYEIDIHLWLCQYGQQKFIPFFLCKHLLKKIMDNVGLQFKNHLTISC